MKKSHEVRNSSLKQTQSRSTWQRRNRSAADSTIQAAEGTKEETGTVRERKTQAGKTDGNDMRKPEAIEASQATAVPEEYGPDAERQEVGREHKDLQTSHDLGTDQQQTQRSRV